MDKHSKKLEEETMQFVYLLGDEDGRTLICEYQPHKMRDYARLAVLSLILGYKAVFAKIIVKVETDIQKFMSELSGLNGNFGIVDGWMNDFINSISQEEFREMTRCYWEERKAKIDRENFTLHCLT